MKNADGRHFLLGKESDKFIGLPVPKSDYIIGTNSAKAVMKRLKLTYPVVLKLISQQAIHKSDVGGVKIVNNDSELEKAINDLQKTIKKIKDGKLLLQEFIKGHELIVGIKHDATFGPIIAFGIGGKYVEILKDIVFRACPIDPKEAEDMIEQLKFKAIIEGARGGIKANKKLLANALVNVSKLAVSKKITELDVNPLIVTEKNIYAVDVRLAFL
ncbi:MAG: acetate--CoA ligase family protein [Candidatus Aenigmarchaeota archaeon]|nr:acetate--CoA ligase family protein [Candidatus Aenigmarchaeota archaeon]